MTEVVRVLVVHGPNLNLLGTREPELYGTTTLAEIDARLAALAKDAGCDTVVVLTCEQHPTGRLILTYTAGSGLVRVGCAECSELEVGGRFVGEIPVAGELTVEDVAKLARIRVDRARERAKKA